MSEAVLGWKSKVLAPLSVGRLRLNGHVLSKLNAGPTQRIAANRLRFKNAEARQGEEFPNLFVGI